MRRAVLVLTGALLRLAALASDSPKEYDDATVQADEIRGEWRLVAVEFCGQKSDFVGVVESYRGGRWTAKSEDNETYQGNYRVNAGRRPAHLDLVQTKGPLAGKTRRFIYQVNGDTLKTSEMMNGNERPKEFDDKLDAIVCTYQRVKK
jgi:uncharacterized protein (TIGR03067 family)